VTRRLVRFFRTGLGRPPAPQAPRNVGRCSRPGSLDASSSSASCSRRCTGPWLAAPAGLPVSRILPFTNAVNKTICQDKIDPLGYTEAQPTGARVLAAADTFKRPVAFVDASGKAAYPAGNDHITIEFTDAAGLRWRRRNNEAPEPVISQQRRRP
jgi:hypothetical protein